MTRNIEYAVHVAGKSLSECELDRRALSLGEAERDKVIMQSFNVFNNNLIQFFP